MELNSVCLAFMDNRRAARCTPNTLARYDTALTQWRRWRAGEGLPTQLPAMAIEEFRGYLHYLSFERRPHQNNPKRPSSDRKGLLPSAVAAERAVLRALWNFAAGEGWLTAEQERFFHRGRLPVPAADVIEEDRPYWDEEVVEKLLAACGKRRTEQTLRDRAIIRMFFATGMRLHELCRLEEAHCNHAERAARIVGKGRKKRWIFWDEETAKALLAYREVRRGELAGPVFRGVNRKNNGGAMSTDSVRARIKRIFRKAGMEPPPQAPVHSGRHGFAHAMLDGGAKLTNIQQLMGHASLTTTQRYLRERKDKLRSAYMSAQARRQLRGRSGAGLR